MALIYDVEGPWFKPPLRFDFSITKKTEHLYSTCITVVVVLIVNINSPVRSALCAVNKQHISMMAADEQKVGLGLTRHKRWQAYTGLGGGGGGAYR